MNHPNYLNLPPHFPPDYAAAWGEDKRFVGCIPCTSALEDWQLPLILLSRAGRVATLVHGMHPTGFDRKAAR